MNKRHASTIGGRHHRRFSNYLLNRHFQLKYVGMILGMSGILSFGLGFFLVDQIRENSRMLMLDAEMDPVFQEQLAQADAESIAVLAGALLLFNLLLGLGAVVVTHRLAGPIFVFRRYLGMLAEGKIPSIRALRKGDEFADLLEQLRATVDAVASRTREDLAHSERMRALLTESESLDRDAVLEELDRFERDKRALLGEDTR